MFLQIETERPQYHLAVQQRSIPIDASLPEVIHDQLPSSETDYSKLPFGIVFNLTYNNNTFDWEYLETFVESKAYQVGKEKTPRQRNIGNGTSDNWSTMLPFDSNTDNTYENSLGMPSSTQVAKDPDGMEGRNGRSSGQEADKLQSKEVSYGLSIEVKETDALEMSSVQDSKSKHRNNRVEETDGPMFVSYWDIAAPVGSESDVADETSGHDSESLFLNNNMKAEMKENGQSSRTAVLSDQDPDDKAAGLDRMPHEHRRSKRASKNRGSAGGSRTGVLSDQDPDDKAAGSERMPPEHRRSKCASKNRGSADGSRTGVSSDQDPDDEAAGSDRMPHEHRSKRTSILNRGSAGGSSGRSFTTGQDGEENIFTFASNDPRVSCLYSFQINYGSNSKFNTLCIRSE